MQQVPIKVATDAYTADEFNTLPSQELQNTVIGSEQVFNKSNNTQLLQAIGRLGAVNNHYIDSGTANAYVLESIDNFAPITAFENGYLVRFFAQNTNTGPSTVSVNGLPIDSINDMTNAPLVGGEIIAGEYITIVCRGTNFRLYRFNETDLSQPLVLANQNAGVEGARNIGHTNINLFDTTAKAFAFVSEAGGIYTLQNNLNVASVNRLSTGFVQVNFINPMPNLNYSVCVTIIGTLNIDASFRGKTLSSVRVLIGDRGEFAFESSFSISIRGF